MKMASDFTRSHTQAFFSCPFTKQTVEGIRALRKKRKETRARWKNVLPKTTHAHQDDSIRSRRVTRPTSYGDKKEKKTIAVKTIRTTSTPSSLCFECSNRKSAELDSFSYIPDIPRINFVLAESGTSA